MKNLLFVLNLLMLSPRLARAQEAPTATIAERVLPSRAVPKALAAFVPRGGKSRFWGASWRQCVEIGTRMARLINVLGHFL